MTRRQELFNELKQKMQDAGFQFEKEQAPFFQKKRDKEFKFVHPQLLIKFEKDGIKTRAKKFYIKPLSDDNCEIGLTTGKTSALNTGINPISPNTVDTYHVSPAWSNNMGDNRLDNLLDFIKKYLQK